MAMTPERLLILARQAVAEGRPDDALEVLTRDFVAQRPELAPDTAALVRMTDNLGDAVALLEPTPLPEPSRYDVLRRIQYASYRDYADASPESFKHLEEVVGADYEHTDDGIRARALILRAELCWTRGQYGMMREILTAAEGPAPRAADDAERTSLLNSIRRWQVRADLLGPTPVDEAMRTCDSVVAGAAASVRAVGLAVKGGLHAMAGEFEAAERCFAQSWDVGDEHGLRDWLAALTLYVAPAKLLSGDAAAAEATLRDGVAELDNRKERSRAETANAFLAHALCDQEKFRDPFWSNTTVVPQAKDDIYTQALWKSALARRLAGCGDQAALDCGQEAIADADSTDSFNLKGDVRLAHAEAILRLRSASGRPEAERLVEAALEMYKAKGNEAARARASELIGRFT
jgi:hypothetical protein